MKVFSRLVPLALLVFSFAFSACEKEPLEVVKDPTEDEKQWIPYTGAGFQNKFFRDETGYLHQMNLFWEATAKDKYGSDETVYYSDRLAKMICFGRPTDQCGVILTKRDSRIKLEINFPPDNYKLSIGHDDLNNTVDSVNLWGHVFYDVVVFTNNIAVTWTGPCHRLYLVKGLGIVGVEYRDGRHYVME